MPHASEPAGVSNGLPPPLSLFRLDVLVVDEVVELAVLDESVRRSLVVDACVECEELAEVVLLSVDAVADASELDVLVTCALVPSLSMSLLLEGAADEVAGCVAGSDIEAMSEL